MFATDLLCLQSEYPRTALATVLDVRADLFDHLRKGTFPTAIFIIHLALYKNVACDSLR